VKGFKREKMPVNVEDVLHTFERAQRHFQRHLREMQQQEVEIEVQEIVPVSDRKNNNVPPPVSPPVSPPVLEVEDEDEFDPFDNPTNAEPPTFTKVESEDDEFEQDGFEIEVFTPTVTPTTNTNKGNEPSTKDLLLTTTATSTAADHDKDHHDNDHESDVQKFKEIQNNQVTGPRGGKEDPSPKVQPTEISFMIIMDDYNYSNDAETTNDIGIGTKFAFTGRIVTKAEELGSAVGTCTVTSNINTELSYCEIFHKIDTDNYGGFGVVQTSGTSDEVGGRLLITGTGGSLSKVGGSASSGSGSTATDKGYSMVQFDPAGNPVLYVLLKLF